MGLRPISFIATNSSAVLLNNIINESQVYDIGNIRRIVLKRIIFYY